MMVRDKDCVSDEENELYNIGIALTFAVFENI
jgi:hypothetical protein